ncbi:hypothetical protein EON83_06990, partial [bacterium]
MKPSLSPSSARIAFAHFLRSAQTSLVALVLLLAFALRGVWAQEALPTPSPTPQGTPAATPTIIPAGPPSATPTVAPTPSPGSLPSIVPSAPTKIEPNISQPISGFGDPNRVIDFPAIVPAATPTPLPT